MLQRTKEIVESLDRPRHEGTRHIDEEDVNVRGAFRKGRL